MSDLRFNATVEERGPGDWFARSHEFPGISASGAGRDEVVAKLKCEVEQAFVSETRLRVLIEDPRVKAAALRDRIAERAALFGQMIDDVKRVLISESLDARYVTEPVISHLARVYASTLNVDGLVLIGTLTTLPAATWAAYLIERMHSDSVHAQGIVQAVLASPGISQPNLRRKLGVPKADMARLLLYMQTFGLVRRADSGLTRRVYPGSQIENGANRSEIQAKTDSPASQ